MYYWNDLAEIPAGIGPTVITIGNFDGVHLGHQHVLNRLVKVARAQDAAAVAISFDPHPAQVHRPESAPELIMGTVDRVQALADTGLDGLLMMHYTLDLASLTAGEFVRTVLVDALKVKTVVIGHDVRFGRGNAGDLETMRALGAELGFEVEAVDDFGALADGPASGRRCSSTWIREALREGDVRTAARLLGRTHRMRGEVVHGAARGRELGFPTANILTSEEMLMLPYDGVYEVDAFVEGSRYKGVMNIGFKPTVNDSRVRTIEVYLIDFSADIYGSAIRVEPLRRLRDEKAFGNADALRFQIEVDVARVKRGI